MESDHHNKHSFLFDTFFLCYIQLMKWSHGQTSHYQLANIKKCHFLEDSTCAVLNAHCQSLWVHETSRAQHSTALWNRIKRSWRVLWLGKKRKKTKRGRKPNKDKGRVVNRELFFFFFLFSNDLGCVSESPFWTGRKDLLHIVYALTQVPNMSTSHFLPHGPTIIHPFKSPTTPFACHRFLSFYNDPLQIDVGL